MSEELYSTYKTALFFWKIIPPFLLVLGAIGNTLTVIVLTQRRVRTSPTSVFLSALAVSDLLALVTGLLRQWIKYTFEFDIREDIAVSGCRLHWFVVYLVTQFSSWMLICVTVERVISTCLPQKRHKICTFKSAIIAVAVILCCLVILNLHYLFGYGNVYLSVNNSTELIRCVPLTKQYEDFNTYTWVWIDLCVFYLIPMLVLLSGNSLILYKVVSSYRRTRHSVAPIGMQQRNKISSLTITLMLVSALFIVCITPIVVYPIGDPYWKIGASQEKLATLFLCESMANLFMYVNHTVNFILYFLSGSKFKKEVKRLLCRRKQPASETTTVSRSAL